MVLGFLLFRLFDVIKIFPASWAQDNFEGGIGVVADDLFAGLQAAVVLYLFTLFISFWIYHPTKYFVIPA